MFLKIDKLAIKLKLFFEKKDKKIVAKSGSAINGSQIVDKVGMQVNNFYPREVISDEQLINIEKKIQKNIENNFGIIISKNPTLDFKEVDNLSIKHTEDVLKLLSRTKTCDVEAAEIIASNLSSIFLEKNDRKRSEKIAAVDFLIESTVEEKSFLVWAFLTKISVANVELIHSWPLIEVERKYGKTMILEPDQMNIFNKYWTHIDGNVYNAAFTSLFDEIFTYEALQKNGVSSKEEFFLKFPQFNIKALNAKSSQYSIEKFAPFISGALKIAAMALLVNCGFSFSKE